MTGTIARQFGFGREKSTIEAVSLERNVEKEAKMGKGARRKFCGIITLDIKNTFDCARWANMKGALEQIEVPAYLTQIIDSFLSDRQLRYDTSKGQSTYEVTTGVSQVSV